MIGLEEHEGSEEVEQEGQMEKKTEEMSDRLEKDEETKEIKNKKDE